MTAACHERGPDTTRKRCIRLRHPRLLLASAAAGAALTASTALLVMPAAPAFAAISCADATAAANTASSEAKKTTDALAAAQAKLKEDQAALAAAQQAILPVPANIAAAQGAVNADQKAVTDATAANNAAVAKFNDAEKARVAACAGTAPVARDDTYSTAMNTNLVIGAAGILANDTDADGDPLASALIAGAQHGNVNVAGNGSFTYVPTTNYVGPDQFTYKACDPGGKCDTATVFITVKGATTPPTNTTQPPAGLPGGVKPPRPIIVKPPAPGNTTIVNPPTAPGNTTVVAPPAQAPNNTIVVPPAPSGNGFGQIGQAPAGAASTGFGPNA